ncbi:MAG: HipA N-terminal domain-containing protein [Lachnospiraceae bacterium]|nr:HipA N-terminal domain-containing protein [Lachnospiraceae bacterium]
MSEKRIYAYAAWEQNNPIGTFFVNQIRGKETYSFEYDETWLLRHSDIFLDPDIMPYPGRQYLNDGKETYGMLQDMSPDRWGRKLIQRKEAIAAQKEGRSVRTLLPSDYLLNVNDVTRSGGIRLTTERQTEFNDTVEKLSVPPITELRELEQAVQGFERTDKEEEKWLNTLINPGSSLGGARPKANIFSLCSSILCFHCFFQRELSDPQNPEYDPDRKDHRKPDPDL